MFVCCSIQELLIFQLLSIGLVIVAEVVKLWNPFKVVLPIFLYLVIDATDLYGVRVCFC